MYPLSRLQTGEEPKKILAFHTLVLLAGFRSIYGTNNRSHYRRVFWNINRPTPRNAENAFAAMAAVLG